MSAEIIPFDRQKVSPALRHASDIADAMDLLSSLADDVAALAYGLPHGLHDRTNRETRFANLMKMLDV